MFRKINRGVSGIIGSMTAIVGICVVVLGAPLAGILIAAAGLLWDPDFRRWVIAPPKVVPILAFVAGLALLPA